MLAGRSPLEKRAWLYSTARQKAALNRTDNIAKLYCGSAEANLIREACQIGMLRGGALSMFVDEITSRFRRPGHVSPPQICKARMAAGESADITTATDSKGEGRFIEELRSVSVRTQRPNRHNSAPAEKFHGVSRSLTSRLRERRAVSLLLPERSGTIAHRTMREDRSNPSASLGDPHVVIRPIAE